VQLQTTVNELVKSLRSKGQSSRSVRPDVVKTIKGGIFSPISRMHGHVVMQLVTMCSWHWWHFQGHGFKGQDHRLHFL